MKTPGGGVKKIRTLVKDEMTLGGLFKVLAEEVELQIDQLSRKQAVRWPD